ncbi:N-acetylglucosamine-6-phosphate deacetylase [Hoeflea sp. IMCC20628]|uniref:N-acetylglucosamine-6-phosphate deacetylase n=1 Tax=Hoeflea sp. IMCC20628 TaxID=1620421 RepID=UPI00063A8BAC|nr:N-acetylglucosamine-6-phosphate deacetylase [Hoeflea sp. IMCC20628]AKI02664.1 N-acetylglucosamine-6-phosphate deacetylase [Hoeflea sp. IMCC20628]
MARQALSGARLFDGTRFHDNSTLLIANGKIEAIVPDGETISDCEQIDLAGGILAPGFIDAQVNGGSGRMLNDDPSSASMFMIAEGHRPFGTTSLLPTLITDVEGTVEHAISAAAVAVAAGRGVAGLHLEGPHLAPSRKGTHLAKYMRPLQDSDVDRLTSAATGISTLVVTLAAEQVTPAQVSRLANAGVIVCLGHTDSDAASALRLFDAGARGVTHLFNAMSGFGHRQPGLVGAALDHPDVWGGIIADGHHVDPLALRVALRAKRGPGRLYFVTDAMSLVGQERDHFTLNGRTIWRKQGGYCSRLALEDGTLAGSDLDMASAVRFGVQYLDLSLGEALRMASAYPADFLRLHDRGRLMPGMRADLVHLGEGLHVRQTWLGGAASGQAG